MKASFLAVCATGTVVLVSAFAGTRTSARLHPESLARFEAITSYCRAIDPAGRDLYLSKLSDLTRGESADQISAQRNSDSYREAMAEANQTLARASESTGLQGCSEFLARK